MTLPTIKSTVSIFLDTADLTVGSVQQLFTVCETHRRAEQFTVADPGFPRGDGTNSPGGGALQHTILPNFPKTCMKLKEFGPRWPIPRPS